MQCEPVCVIFDEISTMLSIPGVTVEELNALLQRQKALHIITEHALKIDRPLVISNLDHRKLDLLNAEDGENLFATSLHEEIPWQPHH
jgi:chromatin assembly factor 1 subunit A